MYYTLTAPQHLQADIDLPASKSISNRALIIHALAHGSCLPKNLSDCDDTEVMINALKDMPEVINIKAAGTAMRFLTAYLAVNEGEHVITGTERMKHRPISILVDALRYLGADISYEGEEGFPPLRIRGHQLDGGSIEVDGNISSQFISALLMIGPVMKNGLELKLKSEVISRPYIDLTLWTMHEFGADAEWSDVDTITVKPKPYEDHPYLIENDWSAASYWYEMAALCPEEEPKIQLEGLMDASKQGDSVVKYLFSLLGVKTTFTTSDGKPTAVKLLKHRCLLPRLDYDFSGSPDLAQTFVVCCCEMGLPFRFTGLQTLKIKETDRIEALKAELRKMGFVIYDENGETLFWTGERCQTSDAPIDTYEDHRMALAFAPAAFRHPGLKINNPHVVTKSYPHYWEDLKNVGFQITEQK
ncbi:MAG: 3-phosphoshikimate 1-carboxyvinyltransferase [Prevotellaceae bacterium]|nr:3-phosphoshikimate 1-carboxyvinyltransferase [Prevotellaceae bacterium]